MCRQLRVCNHHLRSDTVIISHCDQVPQQYDPQCPAASKKYTHPRAQCHTGAQGHVPTVRWWYINLEQYNICFSCFRGAPHTSAAINVSSTFLLVHLLGVKGHGRRRWPWALSAIDRLGSITGGQARAWWYILCQRSDVRDTNSVW